MLYKLPISVSVEAIPFVTTAEKVMLYGYTLLWLLNSSAIEPHLKNIEPLLQDHRRKEAELPVLLSVEEDDTVDVYPSTLKDVWESYKEWLMLILTHFIAVERLVGYVTGPHFHYDEIAIKLLVTPWPSSPDPLPSVRSLLKEGLVGAIQNDPKLNKEIISFLEDRKFPTAATKALGKLGHIFQGIQGATTPAPPDLVTAAISHMNDLAKCDLQLVPDWAKCVATVTEGLSRLQISSDPKDTDLYIHDIDHAIRLLQYNAYTFNLSNDETPKRAGTVHCEVAIASFFALSQGDLSGPYGKIAGELQVNLNNSHISC